jgi:aquaporin related protein
MEDEQAESRIFVPGERNDLQTHRWKHASSQASSQSSKYLHTNFNIDVPKHLHLYPALEQPLILFLPLLDSKLNMNIHPTETQLSKVDPLKHVFRSLFDMLPTSARGHVVAFIGELIGTIFFLFFAFAGGQVANISFNQNQNGNVITSVKNATPSQLLYVALASGFSLTVNAWTFFRISGGLFNPVVRVCCPFSHFPSPTYQNYLI